MKKFPNSRYKKLFEGLFYLVLYIYFFSHYLLWINSQWFHPDEPLWIWVSQKYFRLFFLERNFFHPDWNESFNNFGKFNPKIGQYIMGLSLFLAGEIDHEFSADKYNFFRSKEWNSKMGHTPAWHTLFFARLPIPFFGAGLCVLLFCFLKKVLHWFPAFLASLWLGNHPLIIRFSSLAMQDIPALCFALLFLTHLISVNWRNLNNFLKYKKIFQLVLNGFLLGLAVATKMNNMVLIVILFIYWGWITFCRPSGRKIKFELRKANLKNWLGKNLIIIGTGFFIFEISNPYLYSHTPLALIILGVLIKTLRFLYPEEALWNFSQKIFALKQILFPTEWYFKLLLYFLLIMGGG